jgi:hypothetical protein
VEPAKFIAVWEELNPREVAVVPVAKLPRVKLSALADGADAARIAPARTRAKLCKLFMETLLAYHRPTALELRL